MATSSDSSQKSPSIPRLALRPNDAARALGISERKLAQLTADGHVPHLRVGRAVLYPTELLAQWLSDRAASGEPLP